MESIKDAIIKFMDDFNPTECSTCNSIVIGDLMVNQDTCEYCYRDEMNIYHSK